MNNRKKQSQIIAALNKFLTDEISLHAVNYEFDKLAPDIRDLGLSFRVMPVIEYYLDDELTFARNKKSHAMEIGDLQTACKFREREKTLLLEKSGTEAAILRREPSLFECSGNVINAYLATNKKEKLLRNLIEGYDLKAGYTFIENG